MIYTWKPTRESEKDETFTGIGNVCCAKGAKMIKLCGAESQIEGMQTIQDVSHTIFDPILTEYRVGTQVKSHV